MDSLPFNISKNEFILFNRHFSDPIIINYKTVLELNKFIDQISFFKKVSNSFTILKNDFLKYYILLLLFSISIMIYVSSKKEKILVFFYFCFFVFLTFYISHTSLFKHRVFFGKVLTYLYLIHFFIRNNNTKSRLLFTLNFLVIQLFLFFFVPLKIFILISFVTLIIFFIQNASFYNSRIIYVGLLMGLSYFFIDRGLLSKSSNKRGKILKKQTELLERYYAQSKNFVIPPVLCNGTPNQKS
jgi:hypothetical protein